MMLSPAILEAISIAALPDVEWSHGDDLCDCTFQRIGLWKNPYLAQTREIRLCCIWEELGKQFPEHVRDIPGYWNENTGSWITEPWQWNGETDMPASLWHRQLARTRNITVAEARALNLAPPKGVNRPTPVSFWLPFGGEYLEGLLG